MDGPLTAQAARRLLAGWDRQQEAFSRVREARFSVMLDVLAAHLPPRFRAIDLGCGPGSLSDRMLRRFPRAQCVAVDWDPVGLTIGAAGVGTHGGRLRWMDANLGTPGWDDGLGRLRFDAAVSTTALHWLRPARLRRLYRDLYRHLRPGGLVLNGDSLPWPARYREMNRLAKELRTFWRGSEHPRKGWKAWEDWWHQAERTPALTAAFAERRRRFPTTHTDIGDVDVEFHLRAFRAAGFREASEIWQRAGNRILVAIR